MKLNTSKMMFMSCLILGMVMTLYSNNWIIMWTGMEINMISFIPLLSSMNKLSSEASMMYFLIQSMGSSIFMFSILINPIMIYSMGENIMKMLMIMSIMIKMGAPPFHMWVPEMINKMNWNKSIILLTIQKVAPMTIMSNIITNNNMFELIIMMTVITGAMGGINYTSTRKIMTFSSINHMGWIMACMMNHNQLWIIYMIMYFMMTYMIMYFFMKKKIYSSNNLNMKANQALEKINITTMILSLGGMPPMMGFMMKWITINLLMNMNNYVTMIIMVMMSLIILYYYINMISKNILNSSMDSKWKTKKHKNNIIQIYILIMNMSLMAMSMMIVQ
nr:NADH dehydrogenase subunit 2 [Ceratocombus sp. HL-2012]